MSELNLLQMYENLKPLEAQQLTKKIVEAVEQAYQQFEAERAARAGEGSNGVLLCAHLEAANEQRQ